MKHHANARITAQLQRNVEIGFYGDTADILIDEATGSYDAYNNPVVTTSLVPVACAFTDSPSSEAWADYADIAAIQAEIRFTGVTPTKGMRVTIRARFESLAYHNRTFEIVGIRDRGIFGWACGLKVTEI